MRLDDRADLIAGRVPGAVKVICHDVELCEIKLVKLVSDTPGEGQRIYPVNILGKVDNVKASHVPVATRNGN